MISSWSNMIFTKRPGPWTACYGTAITMARNSRRCKSPVHDLCARASSGRPPTHGHRIASAHRGINCRVGAGAPPWMRQHTATERLARASGRFASSRRLGVGRAENLVHGSEQQGCFPGPSREKSLQASESSPGDRELAQPAGRTRIRPGQVPRRRARARRTRARRWPRVRCGAGRRAGRLQSRGSTSPGHSYRPQ